MRRLLTIAVLMGCVLTAVSVNAWVDHSSNSNKWIAVPGGSWSPTPNQLDKLRARFETFIQKGAAEKRVTLHPWQDYSFQFQGQVKDNQKVVFVNAFCIAAPDYAQQRFVMVLDGGPCFFNLIYDVAHDRFLELRFNGIG